MIASTVRRADSSVFRLIPFGIGALVLAGLVGVAVSLQPITSLAALAALILVAAIVRFEVASMPLLFLTITISPAAKALSGAIGGTASEALALIGDQRVIFAVGILAVVRALVRRERLFRRSALDPFVAALVSITALAAVIGYLHSGDTAPLSAFAQWIGYALIYWLVGQRLRSVADLRTLGRTMAACVAVLLPFAWLQLLYANQASPWPQLTDALYDPGVAGLFVDNYSHRIFATFVSVGPNVFAAALLVIVAFLRISLSIERGTWRVICAVACVAALVLLAGSLSRAAFAGLVVFFVVLAAVQRRRLDMLLAALLVVVGLTVLLNPDVQQSVADVRVENSFDRNWLTRLELWGEILGNISAGNGVLSPIIGQGTGAVARSAASDILGVALPAENEYITALVESGAIGLVVLVALLGAVVYQSMRAPDGDGNSRQLSQVIGACVLGVAVAMAFGSLLSYGQFSAFWWAALAVAAQAPSYARSSQAPSVRRAAIRRHGFGRLST